MRKMMKIVAGIVCAASLTSGAVFAASCDDGGESGTYTVHFVTYTNATIEPVVVAEGESVTAPTTPTDDNYEFVGWYTDASLQTRYEFADAVTGDITLYAKWQLKEPEIQEPDKEVTEISFNGDTIALSKNALYVNQELTDEQTGDYAFNSLEECVASAESGTAENPVVIYLAPDVYWTDDPDDPETRPSDDLIGLEIPQSYITLMGMTDSYEDTVLASNRGQNTGANGNYNTVGVGKGFSAYNVTFGNYCNIDLVYPRDTTKNREKRAGGIVQAQVITDAKDAESTDMRYYEGCAFMSRLNTIATWNSVREVFVDCHIECTDDAVGTPEVGVYIDCTFDLYGQTPSGSGGSVLQAYLGCKFTTHLESYTDKIIEFSKHTSYYAFMDCDFAGDMEGMIWLNASSTYSDDMRNIVYNNTLNGKPFEIDPDRPEISYHIDGDCEEFTAFKVGNEYNVYNLVNYGTLADWDPLGQVETMEDYLSPFDIKFTVDGGTMLTGDGVDSRTITPVLYGYDKNTSIEWSVDNDMVTLTQNKDGTATIAAKNYDFVDTTVCITAKASNGLEKVIHFVVTPPTLEAPSVVDGSATITVSDGTANLDYALTKADIDVDASLNPDNSVIDWYRTTGTDGTTLHHVATTTYVKDGSTPYSSYKLTEKDIGYYIVAVITPKYKYSYEGEKMQVISSAKIAESDIADAAKGRYSTDFSNLAYENATYKDIENDDDTWTNEYVGGMWYGGYYRPAEYDEGGVYADKIFYYAEGESPYTYAAGGGGATGTYGFSTTTQGARLVYVDDSEVYNMSMEVVLSAAKTDGQGFGSAKQFLDIFFKYDQKTMSGYGLRISRVDANTINQYPELSKFADMNSKSCMFQLMSYKNGVATPLVAPQMLSSFLKDMTVKFEMSGNTLTCSISTTSPQTPAQEEVGMPHEYTFEYRIEGEVNNYAGFGFQHTGTAGEGKSGNRTIIQSVNVMYN